MLGATAAAPLPGASGHLQVGDPGSDSVEFHNE